jgi:putative oxidoreductase
VARGEYLAPSCERPFLPEIDMFELRNDERWNRWMPVVLRLIIGFGFMAHGWAKLSRGPAGFAHIVAWIGFPVPLFFAWLTTITELVTGFAMFIGAFVTLVSIPMLIILLVAMFSVHLQHGFSSINTTGFDPVTGPIFGQPGMETDLLYIGGLMLLALGTGAGALSVDSWRYKINRKRRSSS